MNTLWLQRRSLLLATAAAALKDFEHILQARGHSPLLY